MTQPARVFHLRDGFTKRVLRVRTTERADDINRRASLKARGTRAYLRATACKCVLTRCIIRNRAISIYLCGLSLRPGDNGTRRENNRHNERHARYVRHRREFRNRCYERLVGGVAAVERCVCLLHEKIADSYRGRTTSCIAAGDFLLALRYSCRAAIILSSPKVYVFMEVSAK